MIGSNLIHEAILFKKTIDITLSSQINDYVIIHVYLTFSNAHAQLTP
jgi:hypothetical protein